MTSLAGNPTRPAPLYLASAVPFALAFSCGAIGAFAFRESGVLAGATVALLAFAGALLAGLRITGVNDEDRRLRAPLILGAVLLASIVATGTGVRAPLVVIALSAAALALQTAGARRIIELASVADHRDGPLWTRIGSIPTLVAGAVTGIAVVTAAPAGAPAVTAGAAIAAVVLVRRVDLHRR